EPVGPVLEEPELIEVVERVGVALRIGLDPGEQRVGQRDRVRERRGWERELVLQAAMAGEARAAVGRDLLLRRHAEALEQSVALVDRVERLVDPEALAAALGVGSR